MPSTIRALWSRLSAHEMRKSFTAIAMAKSLGQLGDRRGLKRLRKEVATARGKPLIELFALEALSQLDPASTYRLEPYETKANWQLNPKTKVRLLRLLAQSGDRDAEARLKSAMRGGSWSKRVEAAEAYALLENTDTAAAKRVLQQVLRQAPPVLHPRCASLMVRLGDISKGRFLLESLQSGDANKRERSALELGRLQTMRLLLPSNVEPVRQALRRALQSADTELNLAAAVALLAFGKR